MRLYSAALFALSAWLVPVMGWALTATVSPDKDTVKSVTTTNYTLSVDPPGNYYCVWQTAWNLGGGQWTTAYPKVALLDGGNETGSMQGWGIYSVTAKINEEPEIGSAFLEDVGVACDVYALENGQLVYKGGGGDSFTIAAANVGASGLSAADEETVGLFVRMGESFQPEARVAPFLGTTDGLGKFDYNFGAKANLFINTMYGYIPLPSGLSFSGADLAMMGAPEPFQLRFDALQGSNAPRDLEVTLSHTLNGVTATDKLKITTGDAAFREIEEQLFGFDDFMYPDMPIKSVGTGVADTMLLVTTGPQLVNYAELESNEPWHVNVAPTAPGGIVTVMGLADYRVGPVLPYAHAFLPSVSSASLKATPVLSYNPNHNLRVKAVIIDNAVPSTTDTSFIARVFDQCNVRFVLESYAFINDLAYDVNSNGELDMGEEADIISQRVLNDFPNFDYYACIVNDIHSDDPLVIINGFADRPGQFVFLNLHMSRPFMSTAAHELGHARGGLGDIDVAEPDPAGDDNNIMSYSRGDADYRLRHVQWNECNRLPQNP